MSQARVSRWIIRQPGGAQAAMQGKVWQADAAGEKCGSTEVQLRRLQPHKQRAASLLTSAHTFTA